MASSSRADTTFDDADVKVGIGRALSISNEKMAEIAGISQSTVQRRAQEPHVQRIESIARMLMAQATARAAEEVQRTASERMKRVFDRSFVITERLLEKAEKQDDPSIETLMEIHKNLTMWATKYTLSEAPKRVHMTGGQVHAHVFIGSLAEAENIFRTRDVLSASKAEIAGVIDVEPTN